MRVWKYAIPSNSLVQIPAGSRIVRFATQGADLCVWALVNPDRGVSERHFVVVGTGQEAPKDGNYVASCEQGPFVWHLFEVILF